MATPKFPISPLIPGGYSTVDATALIAGEASPQPRTGAIVGEADGGTPGVPLEFTGPAALKSVLRSGPAFDCARFMFMGGASRVVVIRAGAPVAASHTIEGATGSPIKLEARDPGAWGNAISVRVSDDNLVDVLYTDEVTGTTHSERFDLGETTTVAAIVDAINGATPGIAGSTFVKATAQAGTLPLKPVVVNGNIVASPLTGGAASPTLTGEDWRVAFEKLEAEDVEIVVPATGDKTAHGQALAHCIAMSTPAVRRERTTIVGPPKGTAVALLKERIDVLRSPRVQFVYPGAWHYDGRGELVEWDPFYVAAYTAGRHLALPDPATSLTGAPFDWPDLSTRLSAMPGGEQEALLRDGITPIAPMPGSGFQYVDSLSGYKADQSFRDFHKIRTADEASKRLRSRLARQFNGRKTTAGLRDMIRNEAIAELRDLVTEGLLVEARPPEVFADPDNNRATIVNAAVLLPDTQKYILLTLSLQPPSTQGLGTTL